MIRRIVYRALERFLLRYRIVMQTYNRPKHRMLFDHFRKLKEKYGHSQSYQVLFFICSLSHWIANKIPGDYAEVGVYKGVDAKVICIGKGDRHLHLFDTFEGMPMPTSIDTLKEGTYRCNITVPMGLLRNEDNIHYYKGIFPQNTGWHINNKMFAFVYLDVNLYSSTKDSLEFMYPKMNKGGVILIDDYMVYRGVRKAVEEFFCDKPELPTLVYDNQILVVKQ